MPEVGPGEELALVGGLVLAGEDLRLLQPGFVAMRDGVITAVGDGPAPAGVRTLDITGSLLMPGMINGHTHLEDAALKELNFGVPAGVNVLFEPDGLRHTRMAEIGRERVVAGMRTALEQMLASGTVAVADYRTGGAEGARALREAAAGLAVRCLIFAGHSSFPVQGEAALAANTEGLTPAQLDDVAAALEVADGFAPVRVNDTTDVALAQIERLVRDAGKRLSTHSSASPDYRDLSLRRTGRSDITRVVQILRPDFVVHMTVATDEEIEEIVAAGIPMVMCARTMASLGRPIPPFLRAVQRGGIVGLGTDNVMMSSPDLFAEMDFLGRVARFRAADPTAVEPRQLLSAVTIDAAKAVGLDDTLGSITAGKSASLVVIDMGSANLAGSVDPLASLVERATAADIRAVLVDGAVVHGAI
ncbi:MAG TPA: amidohydrolase family protein [Actinomycetes bacterium]|nr:amidohydrolase family protein [Actinomycetes bacterium]